MDEADFYKQLAKETAVAVADAVRRTVEPIERRLSRLEQTVEALERLLVPDESYDDTR